MVPVHRVVMKIKLLTICKAVKTVPGAQTLLSKRS